MYYLPDIECPECGYVGCDSSYVHTHIDDNGVWSKKLLNQCPLCEKTFDINNKI